MFMDSFHAADITCVDYKPQNKRELDDVELTMSGEKYYRVTPLEPYDVAFRWISARWRKKRVDDRSVRASAKF